MSYQEYRIFPPRPYIAICPPAPCFPGPHIRHPSLPRLAAHGPPYATWVRDFVTGAVEAGVNEMGDQVLVGRGYCHGVLLPAQFTQVHPQLFVGSAEAAWQGGHEYCDDSEVLVVKRGRVEWVEASDGEVPADAFLVCHSPQGEKMFCARAFINGNAVVGRLMQSEGACIATYADKEVAIKKYEVLVILENKPI